MRKKIDITKLDQRIKDALIALLQMIEREDEYLRLQQMKQFKKNNLFWHGFQYLFWSDVDQDWRVPTHEQYEEISGREETRYIFDYVINIFKAHGESIIAALSADIPDVRFGPRNAQDPSDCRAVESADNAVELIEKWNRAKLQIINALFYLATEGFVASYTYNKKDASFGVTKIPQYGSQPQQTTPDEHVCPTCGYSEPVSEPTYETEEESGGGDPNDVGETPEAQEDPQEEAQETPEQEASENVQQKLCPNCGQPMSVEPGMIEDVPVLIGERLRPKGREIIEVYGALSVRVASYAAKQADCGSLIHYVDADPAVFQEAFPAVADEISSDAGQNYERVMRQSSLSMEGYQLNLKLATQKKTWLRIWMLNKLEDKFDEIIPKMRQMFKTGIYFSAIGDTVCEVRDESMDRHWTLTKAGPSKGVHADPLLQSIVPLQEIHNNLTNMFVMQVEYGVPATYADTEVFDFEGQSRQEVSPGYIYPVTPRPGQSIDQGFYTEKTTSLNKEATQLLNYLKESEEFCSGSFPSIYGGPSVSGSKTLGEYDRSRSFALQRLSLVWYFINVWWGETVHKSLLSFIDHQIEDESITSQTSGGWQTKWIKEADLKGSFDRLEPDASADFPVAFSAKRSALMALMQLGSPEIGSVLFDPDNIATVQSYIGLNELKIPGEIQRNKQMREVMQLIGFAPEQSQEGDVNSTVPIEPDIDDHQIHIKVLTDFLCSNAGQDLKQGNMRGYANCLAHLIAHKQAMMPTPVGAPGGPPVGPPGPPQPSGGPPPRPNGAIQ